MTILRKLFHTPTMRYSISEILRWLGRIWKYNKLQATLNAVIGILGVAVSLTQV